MYSSVSDRLPSRTPKIIFVLICSFLCLFNLTVLVCAEEEVIEVNVENVNLRIPNGTVGNWTHEISATTIAEATRLEAVLGAKDIDYPDCSANCPTCSIDECEHDRLSVNGHEIGLLSGGNNSSQSNPVTIPLGYLVAGVNHFEVSNELKQIRWVVTVEQSSLTFYKDTSSPTEPTIPGGIDYAITLRKSQDKSTLLPGDGQEYKIIATNGGEKQLTGVVINDELTSQLTFDSTASKYKNSQSDNSLSWTIGNLAPGASAEITFKATTSNDLRSGQAISNTATVTTREITDPVESNTVTAVSSYIPVGKDDLLVTKRLTRREGRIGRILGYRVSIDNVSNGNVFDLTLEDLLPNGMSIVAGSVLINGVPFDDPRGTRRLEWELGTLSAGSKALVSYQVVIGSNVKRGRNTNRAIASGVDGGGNKVSGEDEAIVMIGGDQIKVPAELHVSVFLDLDKNGRMGASDEPLQGIDLILTNSQRKTTDEDGKAVFKNLLPGRLGLAIHPKSLPEYTSIGGDQTNLIRLMEGERLKVKLPVVKDIGPARLSGKIYFDKNNNSSYDEDESWPDTAQISLDGKLNTKSKSGRYTFSKITSGPHTIRVTYQEKAIEKSVDLNIGDNTFDIPIKKAHIRLSVKGKK